MYTALLNCVLVLLPLNQKWFYILCFLVPYMSLGPYSWIIEPNEALNRKTGNVHFANLLLLLLSPSENDDV